MAGLTDLLRVCEMANAYRLPQLPGARTTPTEAAWAQYRQPCS